MSDHQMHFGKHFYLDRKTGYWISSNCPKIRAHRWVWQQVKGKIPKGCHIHHKDENKSNNSIENLEIMSAHEHLSMHMTPEKRLMSSKFANEIRHLTKEWHSSEEGLAWHRYHAAKFRFGKWDPHSLKCEECSNIYQTTKRSNSRFCSNACKSRWRRKEGLDDIIKICPSCIKEFSSNKYSKRTYCSRSCAQKRFNKD